MLYIASILVKCHELNDFFFKKCVVEFPMLAIYNHVIDKKHLLGINNHNVIDKLRSLAIINYIVIDKWHLLAINNDIAIDQ